MVLLMVQAKAELMAPPPVHVTVQLTELWTACATVLSMAQARAELMGTPSAVFPTLFFISQHFTPVASLRNDREFRNQI